MYTAASPAGPWSGPQLVSVTGHNARGVVDPSPILMPDGSMLLYYVHAIDNEGGLAPTIGVAQSTDGVTFVERAIAISADPVSDPFPLQIDGAGTIRLFWSMKSPSVSSATALDGSGTRFGAPDPGLRTSSGGVPGALKIGSTYYLYVHDGAATRIEYLTSTDGLAFVPGGLTGLAGRSASPIAAGDGSYLMSYGCGAFGDARASVSCIASSADGRSWTRVAEIGRGGVPGLVKDRNGMLRVYVSYVE